MTISRRDTIILAVLVNSALLSFLFFMASEPDTLDFDRSTQAALITEETTQVEEPVTTLVAVAEPIVEQTQPVSNSYQSGVWQPQAQEPTASPYITTAEPEVHNTPYSGTSHEEEQYVEVRVKRGDFLEKIARANGTSVSEIKRLNHLPSDRIDIGQILRVPRASTSRRSERVAHNTRSESTEQAGQYYTMKVGDNLWNISRQHQVSFDDLLRINNLDEEKSRLLRPGDRIRVR